MITGLRHRLAQTAAGQLTLQEFEDWFLPATWDANRAADPSVSELVSRVRMALGEFDHGDLSREELLNRLRELAAPQPTGFRRG